MAKIKTVHEYRDTTMEAVDSYNNQNYEAALEQLIAMEEANPKNPKIHELLVYTYLKLSELAKAEKEYQLYYQLIHSENPNVRPLPNFDEIVERAGDLESAEAEYDKLMQEGPVSDPVVSSRVPFQLAVLHMSRGDYGKAEEVLVNFQKACGLI